MLNYEDDHAPGLDVINLQKSSNQVNKRRTYLIIYILKNNKSTRAKV